MAADSASRSRYVSLYGLQVADPLLYQRYRDHMTPILRHYGGAFGEDYLVERVLTSELAAPINRVFTMIFPDQSASERFFSDPAYLEVRAAWFTQAVSSVSKIASYEEPSRR